jgi:lipoate-protein ligase A
VLEAVRTVVPAACRKGTSDLAVGDRKFSGNSLRCRRDHLLYHGTLLYDFPTELVAACLGTPPRQPDYRAARSHQDFIANLAMTREQLITGLQTAFAADEPFGALPSELIAELVEQKYSRASWNEHV